MSHTHNLICTKCYAVRVEPPRAKLGYTTCMGCGETLARQKKHTVVPMPKSNYILVSDDEYVAFVSEETNGYRALVPNLKVLPRGQSNLPVGHYIHGTLQEAKDWCIAELWKRRLDQ